MPDALTQFTVVDGPRAGDIVSIAEPRLSGCTHVYLARRPEMASPGDPPPRVVQDKYRIEGDKLICEPDDNA